MSIRLQSTCQRDMRFLRQHKADADRVQAEANEAVQKSAEAQKQLAAFEHCQGLMGA